MKSYPKHIVYIVNHYSAVLIQKAGDENIELSLEEIMDVFISADPTSSKILTDWIVKTYIEGGFRWEDIAAGSTSKVSDTMKLYREHYKKLDANQRDLYQYTELAQVYKLIKPFLIERKKEVSNREFKRLERKQVLEESVVLHRSETMIVAVPLTERASVWWGKGTQWCTAAENNNQFNNYNQTAPLIVITLLNPDSTRMNKSSSGLDNDKTAIKLQLHITKTQIQFMDDSDEDVSTEFVWKHWTKLKPIVDWMMVKNGLALKYIFHNLKTTELCNNCVERNGLALRYTPDEMKTARLCRIAVSEIGAALTVIPLNLIIPSLYKLAVEQNGLNLYYIPRERRTFELCSIAVKQNGYALVHVAKDMRTREMYGLAVNADVKALGYVPIEMRTRDNCKKVIQENGISLCYVPSELKTTELCRLAIEQDGAALAHIPSEMKTTELCGLAVKQNGLALNHVPS